MVTATGPRSRPSSPQRSFADLVGVLPPPPDPALDPYLDAAAECFSRHGLTRTSVPDIARAAGVSRSTVYRVAGTVEDLAQLLLARELHSFLSGIPEVLARRQGPDVVVELAAGFVRLATGHPAMQKILRDEPRYAGEALVEEIPRALESASAVVSTLLSAGMDNGLVARRNPDIVADWIVRTVFTAIVAPPAGDLEAWFAEVLVPVLAPPPRPRRVGR